MTAHKMEGGLKADSRLRRTPRRTEGGPKADGLKTSTSEGGQSPANRRRTDRHTLEGCRQSGFRSQSARPGLTDEAPRQASAASGTGAPTGLVVLKVEQVSQLAYQPAASALALTIQGGIQ